MALKAFLVAAAAVAILVGFALPSPHAGHAEARSQLQTIELSR